MQDSNGIWKKYFVQFNNFTRIKILEMVIFNLA